MKPRWLAIVGRKGGSGKTALALSLAAHYARASRRVLLVDLDPQGSASLALGADATGEHLAAVLQGNAAPEMVPFVTFSDCPPLGLLPGGPELETVPAPRPLRDALGALPVDVVLLDCPPGHAALDCLALQAADVVLAACEPHRLGIAGAARVLDEARSLRPKPRCALVLSRVDDRRALDKAAPDLLAGAFAVPVLTVRQDTRLAEALNAGRLPPGTGRAAEDVNAVALWAEGKLPHE
jgi:chromosome partitioning protein